MAKRVKEKTEKIRQTRDTRPYAKATYVRVSSSKVDIIMDIVRNKPSRVSGSKCRKQ